MIHFNPDAPLIEERRATHEAGHALVAYVAEWEIEYVTIDYDPQYPQFWGHTSYRRKLRDHISGTDKWTGGDVRSWAAAFCGGKFGEVALLGDYGPGSEVDDATVVEILRATYPDPGEMQLVYRDVVSFSLHSTAGCRTALAGIRDALIEKRKLTASQIETIILDKVDPQTRDYLLTRNQVSGPPNTS